MTEKELERIILPTLKDMLVSYENGDRQVGELLDMNIASWEANYPLTPELKTIIEAVKRQKAKLDRKYARKDKWENFKKKHGIKKALITASAITALGAGLYSCTRSSGEALENHNENTVITTTFDEEYYNRAPLTGETIISEGTAYKEMLGENGLLEDGKFSNDDLALYAYLNGLDARTDGRIKSAKMSEVAADPAAVETQVDKFNQTLITGLMTKEFKTDWAEIYPEKYDSTTLNDLQSVYEEVSKSNTKEARAKIQDTLDHIMNSSASYSEKAMLDICSYVDYFRNYGYIPESTHDVFMDYIEATCQKNLTAEEKKALDSTRKFVDTEHSTYDTAKTYLLNEVKVTIEREHEIANDDAIVSDGDKSLKDCALEIAKVKVENKEFEEGSAGKKASNESLKASKAEVEKKYGGATISSTDKVVTDKNGKKVINNGNKTVQNSVGDVKDAHREDASGKTTTKSAQELQNLAKQGANDASKGLSPQHPNDASYMAGYNAAKKALDEANKKADEYNKNPKVETKVEEKYNNNASSTNSTESTKKEETTTTKKEEAPKKEETNSSNDVVSEETKTETHYFDNVKDGKYTDENGNVYDLVDYGEKTR